MNLELLAEKIIDGFKKYDNLTVDEKVRHIYLSLGKKLYFDYNWAFADDYDKKYIYDKSGTFNNVDNKLKSGNWFMTCRDIAFIMAFICKKAGLNVEMVQPKPIRQDPMPHVYNKVTRKDGSEYFIDLTCDLHRIHMNMRTNYFGYFENTFKSIFNSKQLLEMDYKLGYIKKDKQYTDDYFYTLSNHILGLDSNYEKVKCILTNPSPFLDLNIGYNERARYIIELFIYFRNNLCKLGGFFEWFDCFYKTDSSIVPSELICYEDNGEKAYFVYNSELGNYDMISEEDLINRFSNGLHIAYKYRYDYNYSWINNLYRKGLSNKKYINR